MSEIVKKLKLDQYDTCAILDFPEKARDYFKELDPDVELRQPEYDLIFKFVTTLESMKEFIFKVSDERLLNETGYLYFAYPKVKRQNPNVGIGRDAIFPYLGVDDADGLVRGTTLKFSRMVKLDDDYTVIGLKWAIAGKTRTSQKVTDYIGFIPELIAYFEDDTELIAYFNALTPGYQRDWARYVYSAKQEATKEKRRLEMAHILKAGYKSKTLYQQAQKNQKS